MSILRALFPVATLLGSLIIGPLCVDGQTNTAHLVTGNTQFACDLYARLKSGEGNLFLSPYSISSCLAMVDAGAGDTAAQMARVLHFPTNADELHPSYGLLQKQLNNARQPDGVELDIADGLWGQRDHPFLPAFLDLVKQDYDANLVQVDFHASAEPARQEINTWVSNHTSGRILDLIAPGILNSSTRLVLVNAIYFKGKWLTPFKKESTANAMFSVTSDKTTSVPFMHVTDRFNYTETGDLQLLEMRYAGNRLSMVVVLPKNTDGLRLVEDSMSERNLSDWVTQLSEPRSRLGRVDIFLPKFKLVSQFSLAKTLADMGLTDPFSPRADFSGMDGARDLFLSAVVHKAFVEVNEEGTEAAAATGAAVALLSVRPMPIPIFRADHPFLFFIRDLDTGSILFLGRITNPVQ